MGDEQSLQMPSTSLRQMLQVAVGEKNRNRFGVEVALRFITLPTSDSDGDLSSDGEEEENIRDNPLHNRDHITNVGEVKDTDFQVEEYDNGESGTTDDKEPPTKTKKKEKRTFRWRNREPLQNQIDFLGTPYQ